MPTNLEQLSRTIHLRDDSIATLRAIRPDDKQRLLDGFHRLTGKSIYFRFHTSKKDLSENELRYFTEVDFDRHVAIVIAINEGANEQLIGVGRYVNADTATALQTAEIAIAVDDAHHGLGVGTILFEQLVTIALQKGITRFVAEVLLENKNMLEIFRHSGFSLVTTVSSGLAHIEFDINHAEFNRHYGNFHLLS